ncbi:diguanylate cyclase [Klebsiella variicola]|uniref:Diguanylate cyclase n=1 Tax=Klebsiella variicola TaxID=244366 RepID=A0A7H4MKL0_KLEVA|nr:diguanylate cyclase [Klebsiella variicola]
MSLKEMRNGIYSTCPETQLQHYLRYLDTMTEIFEVWTLQTGKGLQSVYCKTTLVDTDDSGTLLLFEAVKLLAQINPFTPAPAVISDATMVFLPVFL